MGTFGDGTQEGRSKEEPSQEGSGEEDHRQEGPCQEGTSQEDHGKEGPRQEASRQEGHGQEGSSQEGHGQEGSSQEDHRKEGSSQEDSEEGHGQEVASKEEDHHQEVRFLLQLLRGATVIDLPCSWGEVHVDRQERTKTEKQLVIGVQYIRGQGMVASLINPTCTMKKK